MIRKSKEDVRESIKQLMSLCFGVRDDVIYEDLNDKFYLYFEDGALVAMTGLTDKSEYNGLEIDWTCTHPNYRHKGYMQELFTEMLNSADKTKPIYCSCWRLAHSDRINLQTLMSLFDFEEVIHTRVHWKFPHNCFRGKVGECVYFTDDDCECYEDLYLRRQE